MSRTKIEKRQEVERKVVRHLIRTMKEKGWNAYKVNMAVDYITPHTYIVTEISYFEWASAFVLYQRKNEASHG